MILMTITKSCTTLIYDNIIMCYYRLKTSSNLFAVSWQCFYLNYFSFGVIFFYPSPYT